MREKTCVIDIDPFTDLVVGAEVQDAQVPFAGALGLEDDGGEHVGKELEDAVLEVDGHAEQAVEELVDAVVVLVGVGGGRVLAADDHADAVEGEARVRHEVAGVFAGQARHRLFQVADGFDHVLQGGSAVLKVLSEADVRVRLLEKEKLFVSQKLHDKYCLLIDYY